MDSRRGPTESPMTTKISFAENPNHIFGSYLATLLESYRRCSVSNSQICEPNPTLIHHGFNVIRKTEDNSNYLTKMCLLVLKLANLASKM